MKIYNQCEFSYRENGVFNLKCTLQKDTEPGYCFKSYVCTDDGLCHNTPNSNKCSLKNQYEPPTFNPLRNVISETIAAETTIELQPIEIIEATERNEIIKDENTELPFADVNIFEETLTKKAKKKM